VDYFQEAFGGFDPQSDSDAAFKLVLDVIAADVRLADLASLISKESDISGLEGEPGWLLESRGTADPDWPATASFRAYVDPAAYALLHSEAFLEASAFYRLVKQILVVHSRRVPDDEMTDIVAKSVLDEVFARLDALPGPGSVEVRDADIWPERPGL
jgi:hypothetical protein